MCYKVYIESKKGVTTESGGERLEPMIISNVKKVMYGNQYDD